MKTIEFEGKKYEVQDWVNWVAVDPYTVRAFEVEPYLCRDMWSGCYGFKSETLEKSSISKDFVWEWSKTKV